MLHAPVRLDVGEAHRVQLEVSHMSCFEPSLHSCIVRVSLRRHLGTMRKELLIAIAHMRLTIACSAGFFDPISSACAETCESPVSITCRCVIA